MRQNPSIKKRTLALLLLDLKADCPYGSRSARATGAQTASGLKSAHPEKA
jgi:hypothetical protein